MSNLLVRIGWRKSVAKFREISIINFFGLFSMRAFLGLNKLVECRELTLGKVKGSLKGKVYKMQDDRIRERKGEKRFLRSKNKGG